ncbi:MAG TPA: hypothetical protein VKR06_09670 [Ktedonosporobacter sp.]|nr:hypothetical protein [Ktedonosporobacter sp.]
MARSRSIPTDFWRDRDVFEHSREIQYLLVQLVLAADDYGRGLANLGLLAYTLNAPIALVEQALTELSAGGLLICYRVGKHHYYALTRWQEWETLSKPTPSRYPAPPTSEDKADSASPELVQDVPDTPLPCAAEVESEGQTMEVYEQRSHGSEEPVPIEEVTFSTPSTEAASPPAPTSTLLREKTQQVAAILKLPVDDALIRIVEEYGSDPTISVLGEADAAREWIENPRRNQKGQRMTPAFFRRWLTREQDSRLARQRQAQLAPGALGNSPPGGSQATAASKPKGQEVDQYEAFVQRRLREVREESRQRRAAQAEAERSQTCSN